MPRARLWTAGACRWESCVPPTIAAGQRGHAAEAAAAWTMVVGGMQGTAIDPATGVTVLVVRTRARRLSWWWHEGGGRRTRSDASGPLVRGRPREPATRAIDEMMPILASRYGWLVPTK